MNNSKRVDSSELLAAYTPSFRFIEDFELKGDVGLAKFCISSCPYSDSGAVPHMTAAELQLCLNQMLYCYFLSNGVFEEFSGISRYGGQELFRWQAENTFIIEQSFRFRRRIPVKSRIPAVLRLVRAKSSSSTYVALLDFEFANAACSGRVKIAITRDQDAQREDGYG